MAETNIDKEIVRQVAEGSGWMRHKAKRKILDAEKLGISPKAYLRKRCWEMSDSQLQELGAKYTRQRQIRERELSQLMDATGCTQEEAAQKLRDVKDSGLTFKQYMLNHAYALPVADLPKLASALKTISKRREDKLEGLASLIAKDAERTSDEAKKLLDSAEESGLDAFHCYVGRYWEEGKELSKNEIGNARPLTDLTECIGIVMDETGKSRAEISLELAQAEAESGCSVRDYVLYRMWDLTPEQRASYMNDDLFQALLIESNDYSAKNVFDDPIEFMNAFDGVIRRRHFIFDEMGKSDFFEAIKGLDEVAVRTADGEQEEILGCNKGYLENGDLYKKLYEMKCPLLVESPVRQCEDLVELFPNRQSTVRILTRSSDEGLEIVRSVLIAGAGENGEEDLYIELDPSDGVCKGNAVTAVGNAISRHPETGIPFKGLQVPGMLGAFDLAKEAAEVPTDCKMVAWDMVITPEGADLVSANRIPTYDEYQLAHQSVAKEGIREIILGRPLSLQEEGE